MKLPNGYGSVTKMKGRRRNPYIVRKTIGWHFDPDKDRQVQDFIIIGYAKTKADGLQMLSEYNANPQDLTKLKLTFSDVWEQFSDFKFGNERKTSLYYAYHSAYGHCKDIYRRQFISLQRKDLQDVLDSCDHAKATLENIQLLFRQMYKFAMMEDICDKDYSQFIVLPDADEDENGEPFSEDAIKKLWSMREDPDVQIVLMMIYSSLRISELRTVKINLEDHTILGGIKTKASKVRLAPIHDKTYEFWCSFDQEAFVPKSFREYRFYPLMERIGFQYENGKKHTPHDCRHTFSWLADKYGVDEICKHMLMGHKIRGDVERSTYSHRTMDELRESLNKIKTPED